MRHLGEHELERLMAGDLAGAALRRAVKHLVAGCKTCWSRLSGKASREGQREAGEYTEAAYEACLDRVEARLPALTSAWAQERGHFAQALALVREKGWGLTANQRRRCRGRWAEVELLLELSFELRHRDPRGMLELALSARRAADRLWPSVGCPQALLFDLRARVAAEVANAERVNEHLVRAGDALEQARDLAEQGTGDPYLQARIDEVQASLCKDQRYQDPRRLAQAEALLDSVYRRFIKLGERHLAGRALTIKAACRAYGDHPEEAVGILRTAIDLLDHARDPKLFATAQQDLLNVLVESGAVSEASRLLLESGLRHVFAGEPLFLLRLQWVEGKILAGRGRYAAAVKALTEVCDGFRRQGLEYVAATAGLDLAKVHLQKASSVSCTPCRRTSWAAPGRRGSTTTRSRRCTVSRSCAAWESRRSRTPTGSRDSSPKPSGGPVSPSSPS